MLPVVLSEDRRETESAVTVGAAQAREAQARDDRRQGARGAGTNFLTLAGQTSLLLFQMLGARLFGAAVWGAYAFGLSVIEICGRLGLAGSDKGILIFVAARRSTGDHAGAERAVATGLRLGLAISLVLAGAVAALSGVVARGYAEPRFGVALRNLAPAIPLVVLTTLLVAGTMALKNLRINLLVKGVTEPGLRVALVAALGLTAGGIGALSLVHVIAAAGTLAVAVWAFAKLYPLRRTIAVALHGPLDRAMLRYAAPLAIAELVNSALAQLNVIVLGKFRPAEDVGVYAAAAALAGAVSFVRGAFDTVLAPIAAEAWARQDRQRLAAAVRLYSRTTLTFAVLAGGALLVAGPALLALHGPAFVRGATTLAVLVGAHMVNASLGIAGWVLLAAGSSRTILINNVATFLLNLVLCLVLVPRFGMVGAAAAAAIAITAIQVAVAVEAQVIAGAQPLSLGHLRLAGLGAAVIGAELAVYRSIGGGALLPALALTVAGAPLFLGLAYALGRAEDRDLLRGLVRRRA